MTMLICRFFKVCEHKCEREIVFVTKIKTTLGLHLCLQNFTKYVNNLTNCCSIALEEFKKLWICYSFSCNWLNVQKAVKNLNGLSFHSCRNFSSYILEEFSHSAYR
jgi:hypothetical protein